MARPELEQFALVGGTNLSLRFGHRRSIDLDLFTNIPFNSQALAATLPSIFPKTELVSMSEIMLFLYIEDVKTDMVALPYPWLASFDVEDGIRLASLPDIAAMKLSAIARRGVKKDFWDIATLLDHYSLEKMLDFYRKKYTSHDIFHLLRSLVYFIDAEAQKDPDPLDKITWKQVRKKVEIAVRRYVDNNLR
ncbi:MAG TPA: nucleotidyl transferase AbiEii/AbiGii toxin family protein [Saprospiraceae bacterium]|nr:nucleotidyl transferase AbiEii/AbiGii toxin family protein [Saprospiraceae bacterium]